MKYAPVNTAYRPDTETVEELYVVEDHYKWTAFTKLLSDARIFDTRKDAEDWVAENGGDMKVKEITDRQLFEARLKGG